MKKILTILVLVLLLTGCGEKKKEELKLNTESFKISSSTIKELTGTWKMNYVDPTDGSELKVLMTFNEDGTCKFITETATVEGVHENPEDYDGKCFFNKSQTIMRINYGDKYKDFEEYSLNGNRLYLGKYILIKVIDDSIEQ